MERFSIFLKIFFIISYNFCLERKKFIFISFTSDMNISERSLPCIDHLVCDWLIFLYAMIWLAGLQPLVGCTVRELKTSTVQDCCL